MLQWVSLKEPMFSWTGGLAGHANKQQRNNNGVKLVTSLGDPSSAKSLIIGSYLRASINRTEEFFGRRKQWAEFLVFGKFALFVVSEIIEAAIKCLSDKSTKISRLKPNDFFEWSSTWRNTEYERWNSASSMQLTAMSNYKNFYAKSINSAHETSKHK